MRHPAPARSLAAISALCALATASPTTVLAAPDEIVRPPDLTFAPCRTPLPGAPVEPAPSEPTGPSGKPVPACTIHAVGDFNGDGADDLLVSEEASHPRPVEDFRVVVGPFDPKAAPRPAIPLRFERGQEPVRAALADVDGDGADDAVFSSGGFYGADLLHYVAVVLGGRQWMLPGGSPEPAPFDLWLQHRAQAMERLIEVAPFDGVVMAFADLDGDGYQDAILGTDPAFDTSLDIIRRPADPLLDASAITVMFGHGTWTRGMTFRDDFVIRGLGTCGLERPSLAGVADVTGDGLPDILARQCPAEGQPERPRVIDGTTIAAAARDLGRARTVTIGVSDPFGRPAPPLPVLPGFPQLPPLPTELAPAFADGEVPPPDPGRGYLPAGGDPERPAPYFLEDVSGDGVTDILFGLGEHTHVWLGGAGLGPRLDGLRSDRVYAHAGFGMTARLGAWRPADMDGDGRVDLVLTGREDGCSPNARCRPARPEGPAINSVRFFRADWMASPIIDLELDPPAAIWQSGESSPWAMGDFDGDGATDILLGSPFGATGDYGMVFGPF